MKNEENKELEKEFVPYQESLELKELGFYKPCFGYWSNWGNQEPFLLSCEFGTEKESCQIKRKNFLCSAPTFSQAFRWFREKYSLNHEIPYAGKSGEYYVFVNSYVYGNNGNNPSVFIYEEAELTCLRKLIEIVKEKES